MDRNASPLFVSLSLLFSSTYFFLLLPHTFPFFLSCLLFFLSSFLFLLPFYISLSLISPCINVYTNGRYSVEQTSIAFSHLNFVETMAYKYLTRRTSVKAIDITISRAARFTRMLSLDIATIIFQNLGAPSSFIDAPVFGDTFARQVRGN